jgi:hypothetical protein
VTKSAEELHFVTQNLHICKFHIPVVTSARSNYGRIPIKPLNEWVPGTSEYGGAGHPFQLSHRGYFTALTKT